ncbi:hypothetical protein Goari_000860, partial [Gossypium aridum]|nr:hypothetical protein [Gossypium aridum]
TYNSEERRGRLTVIRKLQTKGIERSIIANGVAHLLVGEWLKRNAKSYLIGEVPLFAKKEVNEDCR